MRFSGKKAWLRLNNLLFCLSFARGQPQPTMDHLNPKELLISYADRSIPHLLKLIPNEPKDAEEPSSSSSSKLKQSKCWKSQVFPLKALLLKFVERKKELQLEAIRINSGSLSSVNSYSRWIELNFIIIKEETMWDTLLNSLRFKTVLP